MKKIQEMRDLNILSEPVDDCGKALDFLLTCAVLLYREPRRELCREGMLRFLSPAWRN